VLHLRHQHRGSLCRIHGARADPPGSAPDRQRRRDPHRLAPGDFLRHLRDRPVLAGGPRKQAQYPGSFPRCLVRLHGGVRHHAELLAVPVRARGRRHRRGGRDASFDCHRFRLFSRGTPADGHDGAGTGGAHRSLSGCEFCRLRGESLYLARRFPGPGGARTFCGNPRLLHRQRAAARAAGCAHRRDHRLVPHFAQVPMAAASGLSRRHRRWIVRAVGMGPHVLDSRVPAAGVRFERGASGSFHGQHPPHRRLDCDGGNGGHPVPAIDGQSTPRRLASRRGHRAGDHPLHRCLLDARSSDLQGDVLDFHTRHLFLHRAVFRAAQQSGPVLHAQARTGAMRPPCALPC